MYTALACGVPCTMPVKLGHWPRRTCSACSAIIGPWSDISAVSTLRMWPRLGQASYWQSLKLILRERMLRWFWHVERSGGAVRTACDIQIDGRRGRGEAQAHGRNWRRKTAMSGSSRQLTLKKGAPGDQVWDLLCMQLATAVTWKGPHWSGWCPCTCMLSNNLNMIWYDESDRWL